MKRNTKHSESREETPNGRKPRPFSSIKTKKRPSFFRIFRFFRLHPLFLAVGVFYALKGELFLFLISTIVALQHECAHAFAAAKLGYKLRSIVLMPFGAVIDGDLHSISLKDEIFVALCGPICNLLTAGFFVALWWLTPTMYAFTDVACYSSLAIALVNLLPAYPLDGGRVLRCVLARIFKKSILSEQKAEARAAKICRVVTFLFAAAFLVLFILQCARGQFNLSALIFAVFLTVSGFGNANKNAVYERMDFSVKNALKRGAEIRRVAVLASCPIKDVLRFISKDSYLVVEVYDEKETHLFNLSQNQLSDLFARAKTPYDPLGSFYSSE
ncbi:MAG: site-2 protease family protein [Clostridia bacterium]|nr:site-2 protease family protein [Clostridia bacterium]